MPYIDLHCHLDGSLSLQHIKETLKLSYDEHELKKLLIAPYDCKSLSQYLRCFDIPVECLKTRQNITNGILDVIRQAALDDVKYIEIRFAPSLSLNDNLNYPDIFEACIDGIKQGKKLYGVYSNIIVCAMRHHDIKTNLNMLKNAMPYLGYGVCALDLAGDEAAYGNEHFLELFSEAKALGMPFTIHSGECGSVKNIKIALDAGAKRVGHGIALMKAPDSLISDVRKAGLGLELCPTSNYQTKALSADDIYPLRTFLNRELRATINTDNRTVSDTCMKKEVALTVEKSDIREEDLITIYQNSVEISFADDNIKNYLLKSVG